jgi:hypothetical protein
MELELDLMLGDSQNAAPPVTTPPDPGEYTGYYDAENDGLSKTGALIDSYLDKGTAGINCVMQAFGVRNSQDNTVRKLDGHPTSLSAGDGNDNWYRSAANASGQLAEGAGAFVFVFYPTAVTTRQILWSLENGGHGRIGLVDSGGGAIKLRVALGSGGQAVTVDSTEVAINQWHYALVRYNGANVRVQLDGGAEQSATGTGGDVLATRLAQRFQILADGATEIFEGSMAAIAVRNTYPDDTEAAAIAAAFAALFPSV